MLLVCDIGGTNVRIRLLEVGGAADFCLHGSACYQTTETESLEAALRRFIAEHQLDPQSIDRVVCGIPGDVNDNTTGMELIPVG